MVNITETLNIRFDVMLSQKMRVVAIAQVGAHKRNELRRQIFSPPRRYIFQIRF